MTLKMVPTAAMSVLRVRVGGMPLTNTSATHQLGLKDKGRTIKELIA